jgi:hypothetical protein
MSKFNQQSTGTKTTNLAGGEAYVQNPELELASILLTSMASDQFHRSEKDTFKRIKQLITQCDPLFAAKASIFARTEYGMRSITHFMASELSKSVAGKEWAKRYYDKTIYRPDDMLEIMSYHKSQGHKISGAMKKGFAKAFDKFDSYQLGKYRGEGKEFKLIDIVNIVRPVPVDKNREALAQLVAGTLRSGDTWEKKQTQAGQKATTEKEKSELKSQAWKDLVLEKKIGYFALLRNLRNILQQAPDVIPQVCELLTNERMIKKSLVLPFRYVSAIVEISKLNEDQIRQVMVAINKAIDIACNNVPKFDGDTLVVSDFSGSMGESINDYKGQASLFGAVLAKSNNADFMIFGDTASYVNYNPMDSTLSIVKYLLSLNRAWKGNHGDSSYVGHGTDFRSIFKTARKKYDRIVIFSDMQGWWDHSAPTRDFELYKSKHQADPHVYSVDLTGYGSTQLPTNKIMCMAGFSDKIFDVMKMIESDKNALVNRINEVEI